MPAERVDSRHEPTLIPQVHPLAPHTGRVPLLISARGPLESLPIGFHQTCQFVHGSPSSHSNNSARHSSTGLIHDLPVHDELIPGLARNSDKILSRDKELSL